jgi:ribonucleoside-diphosphate reductase alpha chain
MDIFQEPIAKRVWDIKYRYRYNGQTIDQTVEDTWQRVAKAIASVESSKQRKYWQSEFYQILENFRFLPGGRIIAGAGTARRVTLFNCFVMKIAGDSLRGIFDALKEGAFTLQQGGGVGYDFSILRPQGEEADQTGSIASGPLSFMQIWDSMSATMQSSGARRGAMMGNLRCDHPDIEKFIAAKADPMQLRQFNVSVIVTDEFMQAVRDNVDWALVFPVAGKVKKHEKVIKRRWSGSGELIPCRVVRSVKARQLWQQIIKAAYSYAEPGVIFEDTINRLNPLWYCEWISATNPCGEIPLPHYGACNLGSINLTQFIKQPFSKSVAVDWQGIEVTTKIATRFLDNVVNISKYPLKQQRQMALNTRRLGLGFTGLGDAFVMLGVRYGSQQSLEITHRIMQTIAYTTWKTSIELAKERGSFPLFSKKQYLQGEFVRKLPSEIQKQISRHGMRNSHHNAIAPAGTISLLANNVSNGLEPIFGARYDRRVRTADDNALQFSVTDFAYRLWQKITKSDDLPPAWVDIQTLTPEDHLQIQGVVQTYTDNALSKTINLPENFPFAKLNAVYTKAYELGLKGCTIFRPNPVTGSIVSASDVDRCCPVK